ncbi:MAG: hypothetical protein CMJ78_04105 [Planctomycetaceae bacterium]|nr:hypothetical protein [Planctomycetaceae bacterium]
MLRKVELLEPRALLSATLRGTYFDDLNGNEAVDPGEGVAGIEIFLDENNDLVRQLSELGTLTDVAGKYEFSGLIGNETYVVVANNPTGFQQTSPIGRDLFRADFADMPNQPDDDGFRLSDVESSLLSRMPPAGEFWQLTDLRRDDFDHSHDFSAFFGRIEGGPPGMGPPPGMGSPPPVNASVPPRANGSLFSPSIDLRDFSSDGPTQIELHFNSAFVFEPGTPLSANFEATVAIITPSGRTRSIENDELAPIFNPDDTISFRPIALNITEFAGQQINVEFSFVSKESPQMVEALEGWYVDDVAIVAVEAPEFGENHGQLIHLNRQDNEEDIPNVDFIVQSNPGDLAGTVLYDVNSDPNLPT